MFKSRYSHLTWGQYLLYVVLPQKVKGPIEPSDEKKHQLEWKHFLKKKKNCFNYISIHIYWKCH